MCPEKPKQEEDSLTCKAMIERLQQSVAGGSGSAAADAQPKKIKYGAPDGPRQKRRGKYDGRDPLEYPGHEAVAQFLAAPPSVREFKSITELAEHFSVTRMTVYRWKYDIDVLRRADWLSTRNRVAGDLAARRVWERIVKGQIKAAVSGDTQAAKFCKDCAWPYDRKGEAGRELSSFSNQESWEPEATRALAEIYQKLGLDPPEE